MTYSLTIALRIYPGVSKTPFIFSDNKLKLTEAGVRSLRLSLGATRTKLFILLDNCPPEYNRMISSFFPAEDITFLNYDGIGNLATFEKQIDLLLSQDFSEIIMFAEDDYIYRSDELQKAVLFLGSGASSDFITPYDHLDSYTQSIHTRWRYEIAAAAGLHWRTSGSSCLTFLTRRATLRATHKVFRSYCRGNWDTSLWFSLTKFNIWSPQMLFSGIHNLKILVKCWRYGLFQNLFGKKYRLWQPVPSIATHMEAVSLAPGIDWNKVVDDQEKSPPSG